MEPAFERTRHALVVLPADLAGGAERMAAVLSRALIQMGGWQVEIAFLAGRSATTFVEAQVPGAETSYGGGRGRLGSEVLLVSRILGRRFDLVFSTHTRVNAFLSLARRLGVLRTERLVSRESTVLSDRARGVRLWAYRILYALYGRQNAIVAQTAYMAERVTEMLPRRSARLVTVLPNPIDTAPVQLASSMEPPDWLAPLQARGPLILWCGRFVEVKDPILAVRSFDLFMRRANREYTLLIAGAGPLEPAVRAEVVRLGLSERVKFLGHLTNPYVVMTRCDLGLITSRVEGFPNVVLEMMAAGIRAIATTPSTADLNSLPGVLVTADHTEAAIAAALTRAASEDHRSEFATCVAGRTPARFAEAVASSSA